MQKKSIEREGAWGYNGLTDTFGDLLKEGVIDPVLVTKSAFTNAASVSGLFITIAAMITDKPKPNQSWQCQWMAWAAWVAWGMGGMGGMDMM